MMILSGIGLVDISIFFDMSPCPPIITGVISNFVLAILWTPIIQLI